MNSVWDQRKAVNVVLPGTKFFFWAPEPNFVPAFWGYPRQKTPFNPKVGVEGFGFGFEVLGSQGFMVKGEGFWGPRYRGPDKKHVF